MSSLYLLIPVSLIFIVVAILLFYWAVKHNQFDDFQGPAERIVLDDQLDKKNAEIARRIERKNQEQKSKQSVDTTNQQSDS